MKNNFYIAFCDGSYQESIQAGGYAAIIYDQDYNLITRLYQGYKNTTNNRMEIMGVLAVLEYFKHPTNIKFFCDSQYVINTIDKGWAKKWFENNQYDRKNLDLWFKLINLVDFHACEWNWVKGHDVNEGNNAADKLAQFAARCLNLPNDECNYYFP